MAAAIKDKSSKSSAQPERKLNQDGSSAETAEEKEADQTVQKAWKVIEKGLAERQAKKKPFQDEQQRIASIEQQLTSKKGREMLWTTVTMFISSTFRDMNAEREFIVKKVLPELEQWCEARGIGLTDIDLRWGVPADSSSVDTIETCLGEVESIKQASQDQPLFLCILGDRYGWIPAASDVAEEVAERYDWVDSLSITHMEILQGALRCRNRNALFCLRTPKFAENLNDEQAQAYLDKGVLERRHLAALKRKFKAFLPDPGDQVYIYDVTTKQSESDSKTLELEFNQGFADKISTFFKAAIERLHPLRKNFKQPNRVDEENLHQDVYLEKQYQLTYGLEAWTEELGTYLLGSFTGTNRSMSLEYFENSEPLIKEREVPETYATVQGKSWPSAIKPEESGWTSTPMCLLSEPGFGKTAMVTNAAKWLQEKKGDIEVFVHYFDMAVSEEASSYEIFSQRLAQFLLKVLDIPKPLADFLNPNIPFQQNVIHDLFEKVQNHPKKKRVIILLDNLESNWEVGNYSDLNWINFFPNRFPANCAVLMTASTNIRSWVHNYFSLSEASTLRMPKAPLSLRSTIATKFFEVYSKKLDKDQMDALINKEGAHLPLWLRTACEELRIFGSFRQLNSKISGFETTIEGLLVQVQNRLIEENPEVPVRKFLRYLAITPRPLPEEGLALLLGNPETGELVLPMHMAKLRLVFRNYVAFTHGGRRVVILPLHSSFPRAAVKVAVPTGADRRAAKAELALFFINHCGDHLTKQCWNYYIQELLWEADKREELLRYIQYDRTGRTGGTGFKHEILQRFRCRFSILNKSSIIPLRVCGHCSHSFNFELNAPHVDCCYVCKNRVPPNNPHSTDAFVCPSHQEHPQNTTPKTCSLCGIYKPSDQEKWTPLKICQFCNMNRSCCFYSVKWSKNCFPLFADKEEQNKDKSK